ncbi:MAG: hypothetical protein AAF630_00855 [Cyanobacteria bacterium P01_C01_bin.38]
MTTQSIKPGRLIRDSLILVIPIYTSLLVFRIPGFIFSLLQFVIPEIWFTVLVSLYFLSINIIFYGAVRHFTYKKINHQEVTISQSLQKAIEKFSELILLSTFFSLYIPILGFPRLWFVYHAVMIEDYSIADAFKRSWQLTKGYGWQIFWNFLILMPISWVRTFLPSLISASIFGISVWDINREGLLTTDPAFIFNKLLTISVYSLIYFPLVTIYELLIFMRLLALEKRKLDSVAT